MKVAKILAGVAGLFMLNMGMSIGPALAADSDALIGEWFDKMPNGATMVTVFSAASMTFHGLAPDGSSTPDTTLAVTYKKQADGAISVAPNSMPDQPVTATVKDANTLELRFPGTEVRKLVRHTPDAKKK